MKVRDWVVSLHDDRVREGYYGELRIKYENGRLVHVRLERSMKPPAGLQPDDIELERRGRTRK